MLQWMGGSRRKVATSRKSIQKRQKQYFEQRKRQQQQHETASVENDVDDSLMCDHHKGNRSLDILSLLNVTKATEECKPQHGHENIPTMANKATSTRFSEVVDSTTNQPSNNTPTTLNHEAMAIDHREPIVARTISNHQKRTVSSERRNTSKIRNIEIECMKNASSNQLSILELLGDEGATDASDRNRAHEAHVAFSIQGLGNIGTQTPIQSPKQPGRRLSGDQPFIKAFKKPYPFKNFSVMLGDLGVEEGCLVEDTAKSSHDDHLDPFPMSEEVLHPFICTDHEQLTLKDNMQHDKKFLRNPFHEQDKHRGFWKADSAILNNGGSDDNCELSWRNNTGNNYSWRNDSPDLFEGHNPQLRYQKDVTNTVKILDEGSSLFRSMDDPKCSSFMCDNGPRTGYSSPADIPWEDPRDTLTSLSEESCSSSAGMPVWGQGTADVPSGSCRQRFVEGMQKPLKSIYDDRVQDRVARSMRERKECDRSRKYTRLKVSDLKPAYFSPATFNEKLVNEDPWLLDGGFPPSNNNSQQSSFYPSSEKNKLRDGDLFGNDEETVLLRSTEYSFGRCEKNTMDKYSSEKPEFCQPFCSKKQSFNTSYFPKAGSGERWLGVRQEFEIHVQSSNSVGDGDFFAEAESAATISDLSAQGSVIEEGGDKPKNQSPAPEKIVQVPASNKNITPESRAAGDADSKDCGGSLGTPKKVMPRDTMAYSSDEDVKETSFVMKIPHKSYEEVIAKDFHGDAVNLAAGHLDGVCHKGPKSKAVLFEPSCQVMMVERYVLQLLCCQRRKPLFKMLPSSCYGVYMLPP